MTHQLKTWPGNFEAIADGSKTHDVRNNDRNFAVGDSLILVEFVPELDQQSGEPLLDKDEHTIGAYTKRTLLRKVTYITPAKSWGLPENVCVLSIPRGCA